MRFQSTIMCLFSVLILLSSFVAGSGEADDNTVLWLTFDQDFKGEVEDVSGQGNNGNVGAGVEWVKEGKIGGGAQFAGGGITIPFLEVKEAITLECFFHSDDLPKGTHRRLINRGWFANGTYLLWIDNEWAEMGFHWSVETAARVEVSPERVLKPGEWQHLAGTYDGKIMKLYLDGELQGEAAQSGKLSGGDILIGENFLGLLDEVRISNIAREAAEIRDHMEGKKAAVPPALNVPTMWGLLKSK